MRNAGTLPAGVRFQVCLPTPMAIGCWFVSPSSRPDFFAAYERAFRADFGIATECGWGRGDPARAPGLLDSHRIALEGQ